MPRTLPALVLLVAAALPAGADEAHVRVPLSLAARILAGEHSGLTIHLEPDPGGPRVTVSQLLNPLTSTPAYPLDDPRRCGDPTALLVDRGFVPPGGLVRSLAATGSALEVVITVVAQVSRAVALDESDGGPQDAASVLQRRRGRCSGRANLAVGLLRSLGIPARVVHGVVFDGRTPRWHRWGEAWLGEVGWLPFDPGASAGVVSVRYLPCRGVVPGLPPQGVTLERIEEEGFRALPRRGDLRVPSSLGVNLRCSAPAGTGTLTAVLLGPGGVRWARRGNGTVSFDGLLPARYWLSWQAGGETVSRMPLDLRRAGDVYLALIAHRRSST